MALDTFGLACVRASRDRSTSYASAEPAGGSSFELAVVVIGRNEGPRLARCLESVQAMDAPEGGVEVVYVDSASRDRSVELAQQAGARVIALSDGPMSAARARNAGWRAVSAPFVFFVDGDCVVEPGFARRALTEMADPRLSVVWGMLRELDPDASWFNRTMDVHWRDRDHDPPAGLGDYNAGIGLMRRAALEAVDGFAETEVWGENSELAWRMEGKDGLVLHLNVPMVRHDTAMTTLGQYWRRWFRTGYGYAKELTKSGESILARPRNKRTSQIRVQPWRLGGLAIGLLAGLLEPLVLGTWFALPMAAIALAASVGHEAFRAGRETGCDMRTCLIFGLHRHTMQIPALAGHLAHWIDRRRGRQRGLIEWR